MLNKSVDDGSLSKVKTQKDMNACWSAQMPPPPRMHKDNATIISKKL